jgi:uncharacterized protein (TIGR02391 family)
MPLIPRLRDSVLGQLSRILADSCSHSELTTLLAQAGFPESSDGPKWQRILTAAERSQIKYSSSNQVIGLIQRCMDPVRYHANPERFEELRDQLNVVLAFEGLTLNPDGNVAPTDGVTTITEAQAKANRLKTELARRAVHPDVLKFCRAELVSDDYFHAVLEATKSVAEKIRTKTGLTADGLQLVDAALSRSMGQPMLAFNSLRTPTEESEHSGIMNLLKGMFAAFRNPTAHAPRVRWKIDEQDALDLLVLVSLLHRRLDSAVRIR